MPLLRRRTTPTPVATAAPAQPPPGPGIGGGWLPARQLVGLDRQGMGTQHPFSPGAPIAPYNPPGDPPRVYDFKTGRNIAARPRSDEDVSFDTIRQIFRSYDFAQICARHRIDDVASLKFTISPMDDADENVDTAISEAQRRMAKPDGHTRFKPWLKKYLNDIVRFDAGCLYRMRDHADRVCGLKVVDGTSVSPLIDYWGDVPESDAPAYVQYANGVPWDWFTVDDLIYEPMWPKSESPYGTPPVEAILLRVNTDIRLQLQFLQYFTEGTLPAGFMEAPADVTDPDKIADFQARWDAVMRGDQAKKWDVRWVPGGSRFTPYHEMSFDDRFPLFLMHVCCAAFHVVPADLGFTETVNKSSGDTQIDVQYRIGPLPVVEHVQEIIDSYLQDDLGLPVVGRFDTGQEKEDRKVTAEVWQIAINVGAASPDEMRETVLGLKVDPSMPTPRYVMSQRGGPIPLAALFAAAGDLDTSTFAPDDVADLPQFPFGGIEGVMPNPMPKLPALSIDAYGAVDDGGGEGVDVGEDDPGTPAGPVVKAASVTVAGLCVKAADTGRVLLLQRSFVDYADPARGCWEFPGGHLDDGETPLDGARREWSEEIGMPVPGGQLCGGWVSPNGIYQGFVWVVPAEFPVNVARSVGNPDDPDGDDVETAAWWSTSDLIGLSSLRPECRSTDWLAIVNAKADASEGGDELAKELGRWRSNARSRIRKGHAPRRFVSTIIPGDVADRVWDRLAKAASVDDVDAAFRESPPKGSARRGPGGHREAELVNHWAPVVGDTLVGAVNPDMVAARWLGTAHPVAKAVAEASAVTAAEIAAARAWLDDQQFDTASMTDVVRAMLADGFLAGAKTGMMQLGGGANVTSTLGQVVTGVDWDTWMPGSPAVADLLDDGGLAELLAAADVTITGVEGTTLDRLAMILAEAVRRGDSLANVTRVVQSVIADRARAETVAATEINRAMTAGSLAAYRDAGIGRWDWLTGAGCCAACEDEESSNPHDMGDGDEPPGHPNCFPSGTVVSGAKVLGSTSR